MKKLLITILFLFQILHLLAQDPKEECINLTYLKGQNLFLHTKTSRLIEFLGAPDYFTLDRELEFFHSDSVQNSSYYKMAINGLVYHQRFAYWEKRDSVWISQIYFDSKHNYTILYHNIAFNQDLQIKDFFKYFDVKKDDIILLDKRKYFIDAKSRVYYTVIALPVCASQYSEFIEFYFDKKGFLESIIFYIIGF